MVYFSEFSGTAQGPMCITVACNIAFILQCLSDILLLYKLNVSLQLVVYYLLFNSRGDYKSIKLT